MLKLAIVIGSTRPGRKARAVAEWVLEQAASRKDATFDILDIADFDLPLLDEPVPASEGRYAEAHTRAWASAVEPFDGFVFVTPEYNHGPSGALKNALDFLYAEWNNKAAAFVSYGSMGGARAVEQLRLVMAELQMADVRQQVALSMDVDFDDTGMVTPAGHQVEAAQKMLGQLVQWAGALHQMRSAKAWIAAS